jgi:hypothetical protein
MPAPLPPGATPPNPPDSPRPHLRPPTRAEALEPRRLLAIFTVTTDADAGPGSLRQSILSANATPGADEIRFALPGEAGTVHTIRPLSPLPALTDAVTLDATTQPVYANSPLIELDGSSAGANADGLTVLARPTTVRGLAINRFSRHGLILDAPPGPTSQRPPAYVSVESNFIGTDPAGTEARPNGGAGVLLRSPRTLIGGDGARRNVLSGNRLAGLVAQTAGSFSPVVQSNLIGTNVTGDAPIANGSYGVLVEGGDVTVTANVISGNPVSGVHAAGRDARPYVYGNLIGTDATGARAVPNGTATNAALRGGVTASGAALPTISGNTISGNLGAGVATVDCAPLLQSNRIGTNPAGTAAVPNQGDGVRVTGGTGPTLLGDLVSGNTGDGVHFINVVAASDSPGSMENCKIGVNAGLTAALGNAGNGVTVEGGRFVAVGYRRVFPPDFGDVTFYHPRGYIGGNGGHGVYIVGGADGADLGARVFDNDIGYARRTGTVLRNAGSGISVAGAGGVSISNNAISANRGDGVTITNRGGVQSRAVRLESNAIGGKPATAYSPARPDLGNGGSGIAVVNSSNNSFSANEIFFNAGAGVRVDGATAVGNRILDNFINGNGGLGIDLGGDGVTPNDPLDADNGPNGLQNFPIITDVVLGAPIGTSTAIVRFSFHGAPNRSVTVQLHWSGEPDPSGNGEGNFTAGYSVTTDAAGDARAQVVLPAGGDTFVGGYLSATATSGGNTSEFSPAVRVWPAGAAVLARHVFYNNSAFDGNDPAPNAADDDAIAPVSPFMPTQFSGGAATGYDKGINGLMVDVANLPADRPLTSDDFEFRAGNTSGMAEWGPAPRPKSVSVRPGAGAGGSDRVTLVWDDGAIVNQWLWVKVNLPSAQPRFGTDQFVVGNLVGEASNYPFRVIDQQDLALVRDPAARNDVARLTHPADVNRDGRVDSTDLGLVQGNLGASLAQLRPPPIGPVRLVLPMSRGGYAPPAPRELPAPPPATAVVASAAPLRRAPAKRELLI